MASVDAGRSAVLLGWVEEWTASVEVTAMGESQVAGGCWLLLALGCCYAEGVATLVERNPGLDRTAAGGSGMAGVDSVNMS